MSETFEVIAIECTQQSMLSFTDDSGVRWVSLPDVMNAVMDADVAQTAGMQHIQAQIRQQLERELREQGDRECQYREWLERGKPVSICFVNARGANRATMQAQSSKAAALRTELLDKLEQGQSQKITKTGDHITDLALSIAETRQEQIRLEEKHEELSKTVESLAHDLRNEITVAAFLKEKGMYDQQLAKRLGMEATKDGHMIRKVAAPIGAKWPWENIYNRDGLERTLKRLH